MEDLTQVVNTAAQESNQSTEAAVESKETTDPAVKKEHDSISPKFAALAKKEKQARELFKQSKALREELERREAALAERERQWEDEFKLSPLEALRKRNLSYEDITNAALNDGKFDKDVEIKSVKEQLQKFREELESKEKKREEELKLAQLESEKKAIESFKSDINDYINKNEEKFEFTKRYGGHELVFETIDAHYKETQKVLSLEEACSLVEKYIEDQLDLTAKESKKFREKFLGSKSEELKDKQGEPHTTKTLSNSLNSSSAPSMLPQKTEDDRIRRALAALGN